MLPERILQTTIVWCTAIAAIVFVVFIVKDIIDIAKGQSSIGKVLMKCLCVFVIIGIMYSAGSFEIFGKMFGNVFENVVTEENLPDIGQNGK